ncbi:hypothetical protein Lfu02_39440 [Longispora fulva]|uniref:Putative HD phosphohydrolase n=1 Tax=Longispora fulva TaxID=619741 RepID=A0A8J7GD30_9ACTN|nr:hypothetical protein [Longispora fulva]MBG6136404.1 putative HD phosphohydrolase [Longispora fulva]GIG59572.1 hypothetical protein Lfu02_39440 [Longispora fulva]
MASDLAVPRWRAPLDTLAGLLVGARAADYLDEPVTQAAHMLRAAALAESADAPDTQIAAALLHDVSDFTGADLMAGTDYRHCQVGADWLSRWFPPAVTEPARLHVAAKRYLCTVDPEYLSRLKEASVYARRCRASRCHLRWPRSRRSRMRRRRWRRGGGMTGRRTRAS